MFDPGPDIDRLHPVLVKSIDLIGDRWTLLIIVDALNGVSRFDEFHRNLGIARNILSSRMKKLVDAGVLDKRKYLERPARFEYVLTEKGGELSNTVLAIQIWADKWYSDNWATRDACSSCSER